jgi:antitoxin ParD1/3/4
MPTMNVSLTREMAEFVERELASGDYVSASEVVRDALRALRHDRDVEREKLATLKHEISFGLADVEHGAVTEISATAIARRIANDSQS